MRRGCFGTGKSNPVIVYCLDCDHDLEGHKDGRCTEVVDAYLDHFDGQSELRNVYCKCSQEGHMSIRR